MSSASFIGILRQLRNYSLAETEMMEAGSEKDAYQIINDSKQKLLLSNNSSSAWELLLRQKSSAPKLQQSNFAATSDAFLLLTSNDSVFANDSLPVSNVRPDAALLLPGLNMQKIVVIFLCTFVVALVLLVLVVLKIWRACQRFKSGRKGSSTKSLNGQRHKSPSKGTRGHGSGKPFKNNFVSRMIARIEEFDSLTPLVITPGSLIDDSASESAGTGRSATSAPTTAIQRNYYAASTLRTPSSPLNRGYILTQKDLMASAHVEAERTTTDEHQPLIQMPNSSPVPGAASDSASLAKVHMQLLNGNARGGPIAIINQYLRNPFDDLDIISIDRTSANSTLERNGKYALEARSSIGSAAAAVSFYRAANHSSGSLQYHCSLSDYLPSEDYDYCPPNANNNNNTSKSVKSSGFGGQQAPLKAIEMVDKNQNQLTNGGMKSKAVVRFEEAAILNGKTRHSGSSPRQQRRLMSVPPPTTANIEGYGGAEMLMPNGAPKSISNDSISSSLSSPVGSSIGGDSASMSALDTTGSIADLSDSNYNASESDASDRQYMPSTTSSIQAAFSSILNTSGNHHPFMLQSVNDRQGGGGGGSTSDLELSSTDYETSYSSTSHSGGSNGNIDRCGPRRFQLHSIQEESEHDLHQAHTVFQGHHHHRTSKQQAPQLSTPSTTTGRNVTTTEEESISGALSQEGIAVGTGSGGSGTSSPLPVPIAESRVAQKQQPIVRPSVGRLQQYRLKSSRSRYSYSSALPILHIPPPPPTQSSSALLTAMLDRGKIRTGGLPSWFPKKEGLI